MFRLKHKTKPSPSVLIIDQECIANTLHWKCQTCDSSVFRHFLWSLYVGFQVPSWPGHQRLINKVHGILKLDLIRFRLYECARPSFLNSYLWFSQTHRVHQSLHCLHILYICVCSYLIIIYESLIVFPTFNLLSL